MRVVSVVLGSTSMKGRENASAALLNYGFTFYETKLVVKGGAKLASAPVWKAASSPVDVSIRDDLYITVPRGEARRYQDGARAAAPLDRAAGARRRRRAAARDRRQSDAGDAARAPLDERRGRAAGGAGWWTPFGFGSPERAAAHLLFERRISALERGAGLAARPGVPVRRCGLRGDARVTADGRSGCASTSTGSRAASRASAWRPRCRMPSGASCAASWWSATAAATNTFICR